MTPRPDDKAAAADKAGTDDSPPATTGALVLVATPIGNLGDLSPRAAEELAGADLICCEDTRRTGKLLEHAGIARPRLRRVDAHTEAEAVDEIVGRIADGQRVALVSDAGTPSVSDPGQRLVAAVAAAGLKVSVVPGPSAAVAALAVSGLRCGRFVFEGFLPRKGKARSEALARLADEERTVVVYESAKRLAGTLADLAEACGSQRRAVVARELTKLHEEVRRATLADLAAWADRGVKGEIVVVLDGAEPAAPADDNVIVEALQEALADGLSSRDAAAEVAAGLGIRRRRAYALALGLRESVTPPP